MTAKSQIPYVIFFKKCHFNVSKNRNQIDSFQGVLPPAGSGRVGSFSRFSTHNQQKHATRVITITSIITTTITTITTTITTTTTSTTNTTTTITITTSSSITSTSWTDLKYIY